MGGDESVPFMKPLEEAKVEELTAAEKAWSGWLAMEDWMVGPRAPKEDDPELYRSAPRRDEDDTASHTNGTALLPDGVSEAFERQGGVHMNGNESPPDDVRETSQE